MARIATSRIVYGLFALALLAVAGTTGLWFAGAAQVREQIAQAGQALAGEQGSFTVRELTVTGFPFAYDAVLGGIALNGRDARGGWEWRAEKAKLTLSPWLGRAAVFDLSGNHKLRFRAGRAPVDLDIAAARAPGEARLGAGPAVYKLAAEDVSVTEAISGAVVKAEKASLQLFLYPPAERKTVNTQPAAGVLVELAGIDLPPNMGKYLAPKIAGFAAEVQVLADLPVPIDRRNMARFRDAGGSVEIKNLALHWGPVRVDGSGTVTLDPGLQPEASLAARMTGFEEGADALVAAGLIRAQDVQGVKLLLSLMARRSDPGRGAEIRLPITIQDRTVYVGPARLARLPPVRW